MPINYKEHVSLVELEEGIVTMKWMNCKFHSAMCYTQEFDESYNLMPPERVSKHPSNVAQQNRSTERFNRYKDCSAPQIKFHIIKVQKEKYKQRDQVFIFMKEVTS